MQRQPDELPGTQVMGAPLATPTTPDEHIEIRLTPEELRLVEQAAIRGGFADVSAFVRWTILSQLHVQRPPAAVSAKPPIAWNHRRRAAWWLLLVDMIAAALALLLVAMEVETVLGSGPVLVVLGVATCAACAGLRHGWGIAAGAAHVAVCVLFVALVNILNWGPRAAAAPFRAMGLAYVVAYLPLGIFAIRRLPSDHDPGKCARCGYPLYGLTTPRCPECGHPFDPAVLAALAPPPPPRAG